MHLTSIAAGGEKKLNNTPRVAHKKETSVKDEAWSSFRISMRGRRRSDVFCPVGRADHYYEGKEG